ncbi:hypothetical protein A2Y85_05025 [candidate division WOR-3 bacterium RBG_13_43_14]|uniref:Uncharacterized protein n=1 Tax=candidate division WOR-3 bacterium RBG_13_43_14 TaxID=1802590 RepID=A0A1F4UEH1_UNCW3|nr:MAG: hypothetical protein A2Y85_05025 [candidate division WOR-3 bacterium RBG_13_43_14]
MSKNDMKPKMQLELLLGERRLVKERLSKTESMMFGSITVVVSPFLLLTGYAFLNYNSNAKFILLAMPFLSLFAILLICVLYMHQYVAGYYSRYLVDRINTMVSEFRLLMEDMDYAFFGKGFNIQNLFIFMALGFTGIINFIILLFIDDVIFDLWVKVNMNKALDFSVVYWVYWIIFSSLAIICILAGYSQFHCKVKKLKGIIAFNSNSQINSGL